MNVGMVRFGRSCEGFLRNVDTARLNACKLEFGWVGIVVRVILCS